MKTSSMSDDWKKLFGSITTIYKGNNERIPGWSLMREMIEWQSGPDSRVLTPPRFKVFNTCPNLTRTLPLLIANKNNPEDVDTDGEDHAADAARYGIRHVFQSRKLSGGGRKYYFDRQGSIKVRTV